MATLNTDKDVEHQESTFTTQEISKYHSHLEDSGVVFCTGTYAFTI